MSEDLDRASMEDFRNVAAEAVEQRQRADKAEANRAQLRAGIQALCEEAGASFGLNGSVFVNDLRALVADDGADLARQPRVVCLCGSTRFYDEFQRVNYDLTMRGEIVLSVGFYPHAKAAHGHGEDVGHDSAEKIALDELHKRKIDLADYVLVLNVGGYIGDSTRSEIDYAERIGKPVEYLVNPYRDTAGGDPACVSPTSPSPAST